MSQKVPGGNRAAQATVPRPAPAWGTMWAPDHSGLPKLAAMAAAHHANTGSSRCCEGVHSMGSLTENVSVARLSADSICLNRGNASVDGSPLVPPIAQSTTFQRTGVGSDPQHQYSRVSNPSVTTLEQTLGALEDAPPAVCFGTGLAAETALFLSILRAGDHVVCGRGVYGGTTRLLHSVD